MPFLAAIGVALGASAGIGASIVGGLVVASTAVSIGTSIAAAVQTPPGPPKLQVIPQQSDANQAAINAIRQKRARSGRESTTRLLTGVADLLSEPANEELLGEGK